MTREIKFRGKRVDNGEWVYGDLLQGEKSRAFIAYDEAAFTTTDCCGEHLETDRYCKVDPATVGQFTGLCDKDGKEIYEGDICTDTHNADYKNEIVWGDNYQWGCKNLRQKYLYLFDVGLIFPLWQWDKCRENDYRELEVIGNIHDKEGEECTLKF